jgi:lipopolysaccharide exporter
LQRFSITIFGLINFMILIRHLTKQQMGVYALFLIVTTIFEITKSGLLKGAHIRYMSTNELAEEKAQIASSSFLINSLISFIFIGAILLLSRQLGQWLHTGPELSLMLRWFIPGLISMVIFSHLEATQQAHLDFKGVFAGYLVRQVSFFLAILVQDLTGRPFSLSAVALYLSGSVVLGTIVLYIFTRKYLLHQWRYSVHWTKKLLRYGGFIFGTNVVANIFQNLDQLMTATLLKSSIYVAYYNAASRINQFIDVPSYAAAEVLFPKASQALGDGGNAKVKYLFERMVSVLLCFTIPTVIVISLIPQLVITLIAGRSYIAAAPILQLYMITALLRPVQNQAANLLNSIGKPGLCFGLNSIYLTLNLGINYVCLYYIGFYGAAIGSVITFSLGAVMWYFVMRRQIDFELKGVFRNMIGLYRAGYGYALNFLSRESAGPNV